MGLLNRGKRERYIDENGEEKEIYTYKRVKIKEFLNFNYYEINEYRRPADNIVLYFNKDREECIVLAVLCGDDLGKEPFNLTDSLTIKEEMIGKDIYLEGYKGVSKIRQDTLKALCDKSLINEEAKEAIFINRNNVGFRY